MAVTTLSSGEAVTHV